MDKCLIVKIGSSLVADDIHFTINKTFINNLLADVSTLVKSGYKVILVSSGAVALGVPHVVDNYKTIPLPLTLSQQQAAAACGQPLLMHIYNGIGNTYNLKLAQVLLTYDDLNNATRLSNAANTVTTLLQAGVMPIVNENDTVATDELKFGDNDKLAASLVKVLQIKKLFLLTNIDGLYTGVPTHPQSRHIPLVSKATDYYHLAQGKSSLGRGGMLSKLQAASIAQQQGCDVYIGSGHTQKKPITNILENKCKYTLCSAV